MSEASYLDTSQINVPLTATSALATVTYGFVEAFTGLVVPFQFVATPFELYLVHL